jgi:acyl carrier protein
LKDFTEVQTWILTWLERELRASTSRIAPDETLLNYGMDSVTAIMLVGDLENLLKTRLPPTLVWDYPTVNELASVIVSVYLPSANSELPIAGQRSQPTALSQQEAQALLSSIDQLSEKEIQELLDRLGQE